MERQSEKPRELLEELIHYISQVEQERLDLALDTFAAYEDIGLTPEEITGPFSEETALKYVANILHTSPERLRELAEADKASRILILDEQTSLAIAAGAYAIDISKRLRGATHVWDFRGIKGGPKSISYYDACVRLYSIADHVLMEGEARK